MPADHGLGGQPRDSHGLAGAGWPDDGQRSSQRQGHRHEAEASAKCLGQGGSGLDGLRLRQPLEQYAAQRGRGAMVGETGCHGRADRRRHAGSEQRAQIVGGDLDRGGEPEAVRQFVGAQDDGLLAQGGTHLLHGIGRRAGVEVAQAHGSDLPQGSDPGLRVDLVLRQDDGRGPERARRPSGRTGGSPGVVTSAGSSPRIACASSASRSAWTKRCSSRRRHRQLALVALADQSAGEGLLPVGRQREDRARSRLRAVQAPLIWRASRARTCSVISSGALGHAQRLADRLEDQRQVADRDPLGQQALQHALDAGRGDPAGTSSPSSF